MRPIMIAQHEELRVNYKLGAADQVAASFSNQRIGEIIMSSEEHQSTLSTRHLERTCSIKPENAPLTGQPKMAGLLA